MRHLYKYSYILTFLSLFLLLSCGKDHTMQTRMEEIKKIGDTNPNLALSMLDSLDIHAGKDAEEVIMRHDLLEVRLRDKAYKKAESDLVIKRLVEYYEKYGDVRDRQEVYYYAGSVYRDLQDTPQSLLFFLKSSELAENHEECDMMMLRNTYSNLNVLYFNVQDYRNAYRLAKMEYRLSKDIGKMELTCLMHLGTSLMVLDSMEQAREVFKETLDTISSNPELQKNTETVCMLLHKFAFLEDTVNASVCHAFAEKLDVGYEDDRKCLAFGEYFSLIGKPDSSVYAYKCMLRNGTDLLGMYDASRSLFRFYANKGDAVEATEYARKFVMICDSVNMGERQEKAATVNNRFKYYRDRNEERVIIEESSRSRTIVFITVTLSIAVLLLGCLVIMHKRNGYLKKMMKLSGELERQKDEMDSLMVHVRMKELALAESDRMLKESKTELADMEQKLTGVKAELEDSGKELERSERMLKEKEAVNRNILTLLHKTDMEENAENVIRKVRQAARGKMEMSPADWKKLFKAVNELYPTFKDQLLDMHGILNEQQIKVCYLTYIGLSSVQIQNLTGLSRATIWRWKKKFGQSESKEE